uniref:phosphatidate cytidylyltransferase n=1 Tax=Lotharella oceanica TaxID=641309 RepID=A0A7S2U212_9EUKA|mmetsp:Transcript_4884/g.9704  ORF Transcript_4884/g.9704 Transcript_4884/m.9704 type:complete len:105 (+) Transcript_4884:387-701(+)
MKETYVRVCPFLLFSLTWYAASLHILINPLSLVAPFGGFFASAIKRAYDIKDFDALIPGHGGIMDRMDCQFIMIMFTGVYYHTFIQQGKECCPCQPFINRSIRW